MDDYTYGLLVGIALGAWLVIFIYRVAERVATRRHRRRDAYRRFLVELSAEETRLDLLRLRP